MIQVCESPVVFTNEGMQLVGMVHRPLLDEPLPAVVFFHGCTGSRTGKHWFFVKIARALAQSGIVAFRFDFRFSGESEGDFINKTLSGEISDGFRSIGYLVDECGADPGRIGIIGLSMGGTVGAVVAGRLGEKISSLALINPVGSPLEDLQTVAANNNLNITSFPVEFNTHLFSEEFARDAARHDPLADIRRVTCPVIIVNGTGDKSVTPLRSQQFAEVIRESGGTAELVAIEGADHLFSTARWEREVIARLVEWFSHTLG